MTTPASEPETSRRAAVTEWIIERWPTSTRRRAATVTALGAILIATVIASSRMLRLVFGDLDLLAYAGLFIACWVGAGGAIVPIPGVRLVSWLMIVQQGAALDPIVTALVAASAMVLGQTSYFLAARAAANRVGQRNVGVEVDATTTVVPEEQPGRRARYVASAERRVKAQIHKHGFVTVFVVCALPTPVTTITTTAAAGSGMGYLRFAVAAFTGFLVLSGVLVLVGEGLFGGIRALLG